MEYIEHNGSTTGSFRVDPTTGTYTTIAQPNETLVSNFLQWVVRSFKELRG